MAEFSVSIARDVDRLRRERPHVRAFVDPFLGLLLARPSLVAVLACQAGDGPRPVVEPARLGLGACLLPRDEFPLDAVALGRSHEVLEPVLAAGFREVRSDLLAIGRAVAADAGFLAGLARALLGDRREMVVRAAGALGVDPRVLGFFGVQVLTPLAMALGRRLGRLVADAAWNRGYCPVCGSWPGIMRRVPGGGEMTCSLCAATWRFTRRECPFCEAPGPSGQVYAVPGCDAERVMVCRRCNHYLAEFDADGLAGYAPEVAALALAPLELLARQHGHLAPALDWRQMVWA
ncbi:formate dehydrogenase accessory protein [Solidesulfovibrio carbinoliphilus subsp. oakridgensis]|uniref:Formate dehydrogenase accessory protein n=1 Tax=Solidesulfovibrio carbinoliphilus subsp. oakridgensis TaxID=694327 RepID=G7Q4P4_9BACT|nr:formate dehydrogenase accessory protein FdhE [Solidesulfovibrio carbinoliphilus]EHJ47504.1 formate dehydrogenase accessory protein [Solidesulfovibrio carbinoliphilus subsp. oakridgensis]